MLRMLCYKVWISKIWKGTSSRILLATYGKLPEHLGHLKKDACLKKVEICMVESFEHFAVVRLSCRRHASDGFHPSHLGSMRDSLLWVVC